LVLIRMIVIIISQKKIAINKYSVIYSILTVVKITVNIDINHGLVIIITIYASQN